MAGMLVMWKLVFFLFICMPSGGKGSTELGPCARRFAELIGIQDAPMPACKPDGSYKPTQCMSNPFVSYSRECWCVTADGSEIQGTRQKMLSGELDCQDNLDGRMVEPLYQDECKADHYLCTDYRKSLNYYCQQNWLKKHCRNMCGIGCGSNTAESVLGSNKGGYGSSQGGYGNNQNDYGSNRGRYGRSQGGYGSNQGGYGSNRGGYGGNQGGYGGNQGGYGGNQGGYGNNQGGYGGNQGGYGGNQGGYGGNQGGYGSNQGSYGRGQGEYGSNQGGYGSNQGCVVNDRPRCKEFVNHEAYYCTHSWTKKFCKQLCGLCGGY